MTGTKTTWAKIEKGAVVITRRRARRITDNSTAGGPGATAHRATRAPSGWGDQDDAANVEMKDLGHTAPRTWIDNGRRNVSASRGLGRRGAKIPSP